MKSDRRTAVAIVGAGFSGTMVAAHLARRGIKSTLIEPRDVAGQGTAFSTRDPAHLLNVPAGDMSAWPDRPDDFSDRAGGRDIFAQRRHFGDYLKAILDSALSGGADLVRDRAVGASKIDCGWVIGLESGARINADALVLATGNQPPAILAVASGAGDRLVGDPWGERARSAIEDSVARDLDVMILGTGLTMVDVVLSLQSAGHRGRITALSRRGLAPRSHSAGVPPVAEHAEPPERSLLALASWLRCRSSESGWRRAIDSLRPHSFRLWQGLTIDQQRRFLRHARPWWDIHRHRIAPQVGRKLDDLVDGGRLEVVAGRLIDVQVDGGCLRAQFRRRGSEGRETISAAYLFNCTGPLHDIGRTRDPLLRQVLDDGIALSDGLGIGLDVDESSRAGDRLWALGALTKGRYWEIIAVPDIRDQAAAVAADIATELRA